MLLRLVGKIQAGLDSVDVKFNSRKRPFLTQNITAQAIHFGTKACNLLLHITQGIVVAIHL